MEQMANEDAHPRVMQTRLTFDAFLQLEEHGALSAGL